MVFDARTGALKSVNRETRRLFSGLHEPDRPVEELLGIVTVRRADGREVSPEEFSMAQALSADETVRDARAQYTYDYDTEGPTRSAQRVSTSLGFRGSGTWFGSWSPDRHG